MRKGNLSGPNFWELICTEKGPSGVRQEAQQMPDRRVGACLGGGQAWGPAFVSPSSEFFKVWSSGVGLWDLFSASSQVIPMLTQV